MDVEILNVGQRVAVVGSRVVQAAVVSSGSPAAAGLWGDVKWGRPRGVGAPDDAEFLHALEFCLGHREFLWIKTPRSGVNWLAFGDDV